MADNYQIEVNFLPGKISEFKGYHKDKTIIVCGCGASLNELRNPEQFITIGVNDVGRLFDPDYLVVLNPLRQFKGDRFRYVESSRAKVIFTQLELGIRHPHIVRFRLGKYGGTDFTAPDVLHYTRNSPYVGLCLAVHMGAKRIGLIGVDFTDHHFFDKTGRHPLAGQFPQIEKEYKNLAESCKRLGVEVVNLSSRSRLTAFPKADIDCLGKIDERPVIEMKIKDKESAAVKKKIFFVNYKFLSCGEVFTKGLRHAAEDMGVPFEEAYWDDPRLKEKVQVFNPDLLFVVHGRRFIQRWRNSFQGVKKAVWLMDEPYEVDDTAQWSGCFDIVFINDPRTLERHRNAHYLPVGYDPKVYLENGNQRKYPVGFIGGYNKTRERCLLSLHEAGLLSYVAGGPWKSPVLRRLCIADNIPAEQTADLYRQTRIVVNVFRDIHHFNRNRLQPYSMNPRIYESLACGAVVVSENRPEIKEIFPEAPVFNDGNELLRIVKTLRENESEFESVRRQCCQRLKGHTYEDRLRTVISVSFQNGYVNAISNELKNSDSIKEIESMQVKEKITGTFRALPEVRHKPVDIVMLTYNRLKYLQQTVDALFERTRYPFRLTVIDNNSQPDMRNYLEKNADQFHRLIFNDRNEYVPAFHRGIETTSSDIFIATEPDIVVPDMSPCWLTQYMEIFRDSPKLGLLGIRLDPKDKSPMTPEWAGGTDAAPVFNRHVLLGNVGVWMMAIRRKAYPGSFDSDGAICGEVRRKGYVVGYTRDIQARHLGWYEYRDYPEYLLEKSKRPHHCFPYYAEAKLVDRKKLENRKKPTIITSTFNGRLPWLKDLVKSIETFTGSPFNMIVIDNGTNDGTGEFLRNTGWITVIRNEKNLDDTRGVNQGLRLAETDYIVKLDTDTLMAAHGWWEAVYKYMEENPDVGIAGDVWNPRFEISSRLYKKGWTPRRHGIDNLNHVQGGFMVLRKKMLEQIGFFNEDYPHDCMDVEISYRALSYGWQLGKIRDVKARIGNEVKFSHEIKVYHPVKNSGLRRKIMNKVQGGNITVSNYSEEILPGRNGSCIEKLNPGGHCEISSGQVLIAGTGWDNCLITRQPFENVVFSVGISELRGSAILKIRLQDKNDPASNSYHVIIGEWGNYVAKACHVFERFSLPYKNPVHLQISSKGTLVQVYLSGALLAQFNDHELKQGYVSLGVKDGLARFLNPKIQIY